MSSRTSPALLPDPKRPRLLAPGDETSSPPAVPSVAPDGFACANYTGRHPSPSQAVTTCERASYSATQMASSSSIPSNPSARLAPTRSSPFDPDHSPPPRKAGLEFSQRDDSRIVDCVERGLPDVVTAAYLDRPTEEIQARIQHLAECTENYRRDRPRPPYKPEDYECLLEMYRRGAGAERIALVLDRTTSSVINHFANRRPIWLAEGKVVESAQLFRDSETDVKERRRRQFVALAQDVAADAAPPRFSPASRPAWATPIESPTATASLPPRQAATAKSSDTSRPPPAKPFVPPFKFGSDAPPPPHSSATAPTPTPAAAAAPPKVILRVKLGQPTSTSVVDPPIKLPALARTATTSAPASAPPSTGFSAYSTAASFVPTAFISSVSPTPSLVTKSVPTSAPLPTAATPPPPPAKPVLQVVKPSASPVPPPAPVPATTTTPDMVDPDASPLSPLSDDDDSPPSLSPRVPNPVPHHAAHLPLLPLWCDAHYEQGMSGLRRFRQLVEDSRSKSRAASS